ncbi:hypothetical protein ACWEDZ_39815 [Streptomyces sp. NPDC005047]
MRPSPASRLYLASVALGLCVAGAGACIGFLIGSWWGIALGAGVAGLGAEAVMAFHRCRAMASATSAAAARSESDGVADAVVVAIALYKSAVFPLTPGGVSAAEQRARRVVAYQLAAYEALPRAVRLSAAAALEAIEGLNDDRARGAVQALTLTVYDCRADR